MLKKTQFNFNKNDIRQIKYLVFKKNKFWFTYNYNNDEKKILINKFMFEIIKKYFGPNIYIFNILDNKNSTNDLDKNCLSYFVSQCLKLLPQPMAVISYADPNVYHTGYIYQATNWYYTGTSTPKKRYHFEDGSTFDIRRGIHTKGNIVKVEKMKPTFRYLYLLGRACKLDRVLNSS